jgi:hypothetical protein
MKDFVEPDPAANSSNSLEIAPMVDRVRPLVDELAPHPLPAYRPLASMDENVFSLARSLWGKATSECAWLLAKDVIEDIPSAATGRTARGWAAGVLCVVAVDMDMNSDPALWEHVLNDITTMTEVSRETALRRWRELGSRGLMAPRNGPPWCRRSGAPSS